MNGRGGLTGSSEGWVGRRSEWQESERQGGRGRKAIVTGRGGGVGEWVVG